jgi:ribosomal protein S18 acetylase RimI-like enzyme
MTPQGTDTVTLVALAQAPYREFVWIYDIITHEQFRRIGYARRTLQLVENKAKDLGAEKIELHVFGHNHGARALYEKPRPLKMSTTGSRCGDGPP